MPAGDLAQLRAARLEIICAKMALELNAKAGEEQRREAREHAAALVEDRRAIEDRLVLMRARLAELGQEFEAIYGLPLGRVIVNEQTGIITPRKERDGEQTT